MEIRNANLTIDEYNALISILQRAPITPAEAIALEMILKKIAPTQEAAKE